MKNFFQSVGAKIQQWMSGRYGYDELSRAMFIAAILSLILSCVPALWFLYILSIILWIWSIVRCCSRKIEKRQTERAAYLRFTGRVKSWFRMKRRAWKDRRDHRYYRCKQCGAVLRVPRGKGKIKINCPKCHSEIIKKT